MQGKKSIGICKSAKDDVVDGNKEQFDHVADAPHNGESNGAGSRDLLEF
jgi:hypothetical protein